MGPAAENTHFLSPLLFVLSIEGIYMEDGSPNRFQRNPHSAPVKTP